MTPQFTYELQINFPASAEGVTSKQTLIEWLGKQGIDSFVEGVIDGLDLDYEYTLGEHNFYDEHGGDWAPIILCSFDETYIRGLEKNIQALNLDLSVACKALSTESWQSGWKDSFPPIFTERFRIYADWEDPEADKTRWTLFIEPGMAFGTGQHASTQLCLQLLESLYEDEFPFPSKQILDLGTGSGILAIALAKLGAKHLIASDLDPDAVLAAPRNAARNDVNFDVAHASLPDGKKFDLIVANILYKVLAPMLGQIAQALNDGGSVILSGLIVEQADEMEELALPEGLDLKASVESAGWVAQLFQKSKT